MQILVATLRCAVHQQQRAAAYAALLPSLAETASKSLVYSTSLNKLIDIRYAQHSMSRAIDATGGWGLKGFRKLTQKCKHLAVFWICL